MDKTNAIRLLDDTFNDDFDTQRFSKFIKELFNHFAFVQKTWPVWNEYQDYIDSYSSLGSYVDSSKREIDILVVKLRRTSSRDRARTIQRNFVAKYLGNAEKDAALVAFYGDDEDWRFSFVKMEYNLTKDDEGKVKIIKELTPAKRYSFLVGRNEPNHTCKKQFVELLVEEETILTLETIENAFSLENVTKEFFLSYKDLYLELKESLESIIKEDSSVRREFVEKDISTVDFSKKLLGQIVFIYFLQKKGFLGVEKDREGKLNEWGTGSKKFLRKLFDEEHYENFFNDILEPLFYEAFAIHRPNDYYSKFKCKIPFLNGGLFEPMNGYDWTDLEIPLSNSIFKKILDTFDRFNFTVKEDEPLEKEVAIDPEMLGKVFENLLEVRDRKSRGSYYTPREIVHYICQRSLIRFLQANTSISRMDIEKFLNVGELSVGIIAEIEGQRIFPDPSHYQMDLPRSIKDNYLLIDQLLKEIKIVDPAVGSGAFPVGMMNEIVKARTILTPFFQAGEQVTRTSYNLKREALENSLYGVDKDSSAVDIAKLRFWLSLIVDETDMRNIKPLPNLDYKVMCGNSLMDQFEGVQLFDARLLEKISGETPFQMEQIQKKRKQLHEELSDIYTGKRSDNGRSKEIRKELKALEKEKYQILFAVPQTEKTQVTLDEISEKKHRESQVRLKELRRLQRLYFNEQDPWAKKQYVEQIDNMEWMFIEETLKEQDNKQALKELQKHKKERYKPYFIWQLYFSEVFQRKNPGFDVIIANPPYVGHKGGLKSFFRDMKRTSLGKRFNNERMDLFYYFFHLALDISRRNAVVGFITTDYYVTADSAIKLRKDFKERADIFRIVDFRELKIFEAAQGQHNMITILTRTEDQDSDCEIASSNKTGLATSGMLQSILAARDGETNYYSVNSQSGLYDGPNYYIRTVISETSSDAVVLDGILNKLSRDSKALGTICDISQGIVTGLDKISKKHLQRLPDLDLEEGEGCYILNDEEMRRFDKRQNSIFKPWFKNCDIKKYQSNTANHQWLIYATTDIDFTQYKEVYNHLLRFSKAIKSRNFESGELSKALKLKKWWALSSARREFDFTLPKIISPQRSPVNTFGYNELPWYASADVYFMTQKDEEFSLKYILALLNSKLYFLWLYNKGKRKGKYLELYLTPLSEIPIRKIPLPEQEAVVKLVDRILQLKMKSDFGTDEEDRDTIELERQVDDLVCKANKLSQTEINFIEKFYEDKTEK